MIPRQSLKLHPSICLQCLYKLSISPKSSFSSSLRRTVSVVSPPPLPRSVGPWQAQYFLANGFLGRGGGGGGGKDAGYTYTYTTPPPIPQGKDGAEVLPHRRRQQARHAAAIAAAATIPPDASSLLSTSSAASPKNSIRRLALSYLSLSKPRLTALIVLTTMTSYALFPLDPLLSSGTTPTLSALTLAYLTTGTALSSASANTLNMYLEPNYDAKMSRTRNRPLVRGLLSNHQALGFAAVTGVAGISSLYIGVNPTVASLAALNIFLYAGVYTPLKRVSVINTWVGAIVGGIPPLMGWAAASGAVAVHGDSMELLSHPGGWLLAGLLFAWQFPHFNALSWSIRTEYKEAGYQMMAWKYPALNARVALRYSFLFFPICVGLSLCGVTDYAFLVDSSVVNAWLVVEAWRFWKNGGGGGRAKKLFWASVWHLPVLMGLAMLHKKGLWSGVWEKVFGSEEEEEDEGEWGEWEDEEEEDGRRVGNVLNGVRELVR